MKFLVFLGSTRTSTPPRPARLGERVSLASLACLQRYFPQYDFELIDPLEYPLKTEFKPHFAYSGRQILQDKELIKLDNLAKKIQSASGYVIISPEYNHSMSPALSNLLNHFGSSLFSYKPSAIVTYSAGQWGGMRAAVNMRTYLSELGCLPVSAMIHIPKAQEILDKKGQFLDGNVQEKWHNYFNRTFTQMMWWAEATKNQRDRVNPHELIGNFIHSPEDRNAPKLHY